MKRKIITTTLIVLFIFIIALGLRLINLNTSLDKDQKKIEKIINKQYFAYEIKDIVLEYISFGSYYEANDNHKATKATVTVENEEEQITVRLEKTSFFKTWKIISSYPNYGLNVPDEIYFVEYEYNYPGKNVDIDEFIKEYWVVPDENGALYTKQPRSDENWYYSVKICKNIYKTKGGFIYVFNKENNNWEKSEITYDELCYFANYTNISKEDAIETIGRYSSY